MAIELTKHEASSLGSAFREVTVIPDKFIPLALWACSQQLYAIYNTTGDVALSSRTLALMNKLYEHAESVKDTPSG